MFGLWHQLRPTVMQSGDSGMEWPGVYPVEVATVLNMCTVTGGGQVVLENSRRAGLVRIYILLDMASWLRHGARLCWATRGWP